MYSWIRSNRNIEDLLKPGLLKVWNQLNDRYRRELRKWVTEVLEEDWMQVREYLKYLRRQDRCVRFFKYRYDGDFVIAMRKELGDHTQVANVIPLEGLHHNILYYRKLGMSEQEVADFMHLEVEYVQRVATPEELESFGTEDVFRTMVAGLLGKNLIYLEKESVNPDLSPRERIAMCDLAVRVIKYLDEKHDKEEGSTLQKSKIIDMEEKAIKERHKEYMR